MVKTRGLAARLVMDGHVRVNGTKTLTAAKPVRCGDTVTVALERTVRVLRVVGLGGRRGPAPEAQGLYDDLSPEPPGRAP